MMGAMVTDVAADETSVVVYDVVAQHRPPSETALASARARLLYLSQAGAFFVEETLTTHTVTVIVAVPYRCLL